MNSTDINIDPFTHPDPLFGDQADLLAGLLKSPLLDTQALLTSLDSSEAMSSPPSSHEGSPPTSLFQLQDFFVPELLDETSQFINLQDAELQQAPQEQSTITPPASPSNSSSSSETSSAPSSPEQKSVRIPGRKKVLPHGQTTVPIKVTTNKSNRPPRKLECFNCKVTKTPLWRRTPDRAHTLCNACGLYYKQYNQHRPLHVRHKAQHNQIRGHPYATERIMQPITFSAAQQPPSTQAPMMSIIQTIPLQSQQRQQQQQQQQQPGAGSQQDENQIECANCHQTQTPLWRKNERGESVCNACGLYSRLHHRDRPIEMRKAKIQRRRRDWASSGSEEDESSAGESEPSSPQENVIATFKLETTPPPSATALDAEDSRFLSLLVNMNKDQMQGFLGQLERRCDILRAVLGTSSHQR